MPHKTPEGRMMSIYGLLAFCILQTILPVNSFLVAPLRTRRNGQSWGALQSINVCPSYGTKTSSSQLTAIRDNDPVQEPKGCIDSVARRHLLFSLLATAAATGTVSPAVASTAVKTRAEENEVIDIIKPPLDNRQYETYTLPNGLRVLLCSDPSSNTAAAAMDVHVGACADPVEVPGLAHFNEHMLFLGTDKYPQEESFTGFLSSNGGFSNAFTDSENTVYYFDMEAEAESKLKEGLDRFGSFFSSPLFTESATGRELNAIESENSKNLQNDIFRIYQLEKARSNKNHPFSKFFTGNKKTLLDDTKRQGIDLRKELIKFYEKYYSANQMTLAIVAPQSLSKLKKCAEESFGAIPNRGSPKPEESWKDVPPFDNGNSIVPSSKYVVEAVPVQDLRQVSLTWPLVYGPDYTVEDGLYKKPNVYVGHLLGHEGPGSLLSYLKKKGWANGLGSSNNAELSDFETFEVTVELTNKGLGKIDEVCEAIFSYIKMLTEQSIPNYVFNEVLQLQELQWRFTTKGEPSSYVQSLVESMQKYPPSLYIAGPRRLALDETPDRLLSSPDPRAAFSNNAQLEANRKATLSLLSKLTVDSVMMAVLSKSFEGKTDRVEKWYGTNYNVRPISSSAMLNWMHPSSPEQLGIAYPRPNAFIPSEKGLKVKKSVPEEKLLKARTFEERMKPISPPTIIRDDGEEGRWTVHYKQDDRFGQPKAFVIFELLTQEVYSSAKSAVLAQLYQLCATDHLEEYAYDATLAGLMYNIQVLPRGVRLTFGGYNDKLENFANYVTGELSRDVTNVLPEDTVEFERYKDQITRGFSAFDAKQPYGLAIYYSTLALTPLRFQYTNSQLREALKSTTLSDLTTYAKSLWSSGKGEALVQGNLDKNEALRLVSSIDNTLGFKTISSDEYPPRLKVLHLPRISPGAFPTRISTSVPNVSNSNAASQLTIQCLGRSQKDHVIIEILSAILEQPFYEELRTRQQLGYIVSSGVKAIEETRVLSLIVQSSVAPVEKLTTEILKFADSIRSKLLEPLNEGDVALYVKGLLDRKTEPDKTLASEVTRNWGEIASGRLEFDRIQREAGALLDVNKNDILQFWDNYYLGQSESGRRLIISEAVPKSGVAASKAPVASTGYSRGGKTSVGADGVIKLGVDDIEMFRRDRQEQI
mmetsp:Transcript_24900/g.45085  ORF Transcript_24900/g.45085 Transcript_24900/m.45085 type:complete len:1154 (+) Transcript_24900:107-3568(+)